ncbi:MAG TPA: insulinase family protein [Clostridiales bacterium]|nr:insulinase family protein [Clostridiales bacterium]HBR08692.1 insulinase family protein [Clostridiales bacterium]
MYDKIILPNGVRILSEHMDGVRSAAIGIWVGVGSRYEDYAEAGAAHFIEHMLFKGTSKYTAAQLAEMMDAVGGQINAFTTRDSTCFHARVLDTHLPLAIDILSDMFFDSNFSEADVTGECGIILEEIDMYEDTPEDVVAEELIGACFPGALGRPVLGRPDSLKSQTGASLRAFKDKHYTAPRVVVALGGSFSEADIAHIISRFSVMETAEDLLADPDDYVPAFAIKQKATEQNHLILGFPGLKTASEDRFAMQLLSVILGGNASSRLFQTVREKHGLCYSIYSFSASFAETGVLGISTAMSRDTEAKAAALIMSEMRKIKEDGVTAEELSRSNEQMKSSLVMSLESTASRMNRLGYGELFVGEPFTADALIARYDAVTADDILALARRTFDFEKMSFSAVGQTGDEAYYREILR